MDEWSKPEDAMLAIAQVRCRLWTYVSSMSMLALVLRRQFEVDLCAVRYEH